MTLDQRLTAVIQAIGADIKALKAAGSSVPTRVQNGTTFKVPVNTQALYSLPIEVGDGATLDIEGNLVEVT